MHQHKNTADIVRLLRYGYTPKYISNVSIRCVFISKRISHDGKISSDTPLYLCFTMIKYYETIQSNMLKND